MNKQTLHSICDQDMACEVRALHAMNADWLGIQRCAFGQCLPDRGQIINPLREFYYSIRLRNGRLLLEIDGYAARHGMDEEDFDWDDWNAVQICIEGPPTRENYYLQHRIARGLLRGLNAILDNGVIKGIPNVVPLGVYNETSRCGHRGGSDE